MAAQGGSYQSQGTPLPRSPHMGAKMASQKGPRCLKCIDGCPGLELHYFRKVCKNCRCPQEDHDIQTDKEQDFRPISLLFDSNMAPEGQDLAAKLGRLKLGDAASLVQMCTPQHDIVISKLISENMRSQKYISLLPEDKQEFAAQLRRRQLQRQLPLHDLDPRFCQALTPQESAKFSKFADKRRTKAAGIGQYGEIDGTTNAVCAGCNGKMTGRQVAVFASRVPGACWHPGCFSCRTCSELLVDNIFFAREGRLYCGRHYADQLYPRCAACDEVIFAREYTQAENKAWHLQHFCCWYCDVTLAGQRYIANNGNPYCLKCFDNLFTKLCASCQRPIGADSPGMSHGDLHWHACPHCFSCHTCGRSLMDQPFLLKAGRLFCSIDCRQRHCQPQPSFTTHLPS